MNTLVKAGQVIKMRNRLWRVDNIYNDELTATSLDGGEATQRHFYMPYEHIEVHTSSMPDPNTEIGRYANNKLFIEANRLNLINSTAPFLSLQRSRIIPNQYQLVPLIMALQMEKVRMLIADDVGLGKTIEAGLIASELIARQKIKNILIVCPASLREQWQETLSYFFHIDAKIISSRHRKELEKSMPIGANPWQYYKFLITSLDYVKRIDIKNEVLEQQWDMVILDEAHLVSKPHKSESFNIQATERYKFAKSISKNTKHLILMTATPHNGYSDSYASLIELLDIGAVQYRGDNVKINTEIAKNYIVQRRRKDIQNWFKENKDTVKSPFPEREQQEIYISRVKESIEDKVLKEIEDYRKNITNIYSNNSLGNYWTAIHFHKRALSSPAALIRSLENRISAIQKAVTTLSNSNTEIEYGTQEISKNYIFDNDLGEVYTEEEASNTTDRALFGNKNELIEEAIYLNNILANAKMITPKKDSKLEELLTHLIPSMFKRDKHIIIFTKYKDTLQYLKEQIEKRFKKEKVGVITIIGEMNEDKRLEAYNQFKRFEYAILIATDCISEGMNLQHACASLIHYELPWNPNRLEQRNGRVDRYGQPKEKVVIRTLVMDDSLETKILKVLIEKARQIQKDYGFTPPYFSDTNILIQLLNSKGITFDNQQLSLFEEENHNLTFSTEAPLFDESTFKRIKAESFYGQIDVKLDFIEKQLLETKSKIGSKEDIEHFCLSALNYFNVDVSIVDREQNIYQIEIKESDLKIPRIGQLISFNPVIGLIRSDVEVIDLGHPLIKRLIEKINYMQYSRQGNSGRIAGIYTDKCVQVTAVITVLIRYLVYTTPRSILEELVYVPIDIYEDKLLPVKVGEELLKTVAKQNVDYDTLKDSVLDFYEGTHYQDYLKAYMQERCKNLIEERQVFGKYAEENDIPILQDEKKIEIVSNDIIAINLYYPL